MMSFSKIWCFMNGCTRREFWPTPLLKNGDSSRAIDGQLIEYVMATIPPTNGKVVPVDDDDKLFLEPYDYLLKVPGKNIRAKLTVAFNHWLKIPKEKCDAISEVITLLHNASLLIDDIEDNSCLRRGIPVAHHIFGIAATINSANFVYMLGLEKCLKLGHDKATNVYVEQMLELHRGQGTEIYWRDHFICPSEEQYATMVKRKTGALFGFAVRLMQLFSDSKCDYSSLIAVLGLYFQIRDDYANLQLTEYADNKSFCEDITEGKFSFPIIHAIQMFPEDPRISNILRRRPSDLSMKRYAVEVLESLGSFEFTRNRMTELDSRARKEIESLGGNPYLTKILDELKNW